MTTPPDLTYYGGRTMEALELIADGPVTAPLIGGTLQIHPRTARRLLARLLTDGYVSKTAVTGSRLNVYVSTAKLRELGERLAHTRTADELRAA